MFDESFKGLLGKKTVAGVHFGLCLISRLHALDGVDRRRSLIDRGV